MDIITLALAKKYVRESLAGGGAVVGKNVIISSIDPIEGGNRITFSYTLDDGTAKTSTLDVMDGKDGEKGDKGDKGDSIRGADGITPQFTIGTVTTVSSNEEASASITGTSANPILNLNIPKGESGSDINSSDEKVKLTSSSADAHYLEDWIDNTTIEVDTTNNCLVVKKIQGQAATVAEINFLSGVTSNIQTQINNLGKSMTMYGVFNTKADLIASSTPAPVDGNTAIVVADEDNDGKQMTYIYIAANSAWTQVAESTVSVRDFTVNPINLSTETTGVIPKEKIDAAIARLANVLDKETYKGSADGVVKQADSITGMTATIAQLNEAIANSHSHINKTVLDKIIANGLGNRILADNGTYKEILVLSSTAPTDIYTLWVDNSDSTKPILKIYDGTNWIAISGSGGEAGQDGKSAYEIAVDNGFAGTEAEWLDSLKGEKGDDGRSVASITTDTNNNVIVTFSDGTIENIGQLNVDVQADFLTSDGFGNLRYYNGHFQYYNGTDWVDTSVTPDNVYIMNMMPQPMQFINGRYDVKLGKNKLKWLEPLDTIIDGQVACVVEKVIIRRKLGAVPTDEKDGDLVVEVKRRDFGSYKNSYFIDSELTPNIGDIYYYKAFPVSTTGFYNTSPLNETSGILCKDYELYGFKIDQNESDPASMITYLKNCDNVDYRSAYMDYTTDLFNYGDWADAFFMQVKPCMLKYDGTVDYYLNPNDYSLKEDGTPSDIADVNYGGNVMIKFPKVYWKIVDNGDDTANVYICSKKLDGDYHCWSHIDNNGNEIDYCYMPAYNGYSDGTRLRSLSNKMPMYNTTVPQEISLAVTNNLTDDTIWYTEVFSDRMLVNLMLLLIGKSTDTQSVFGNGHYTGNASAGSLISTGSMDNKGLFYGTNGSGNGVKVFGMEHWWGNQNRRIAGYIYDYDTQKIKMTYGQSDGSTADGYNTTGDGYIVIPNSTGDGNFTENGAIYGFISKMMFDTHGLIPKTAYGSATTYYTDTAYFKSSGVYYLYMGGAISDNFFVGAMCFSLCESVLRGDWYVGATVSCKPLATI